VGTLLALLVFFALFGIFLTEYLPLWMTDNEAEFTSQVDAALSLFKSNVDAQAALGGPAVYATSFPISSDGVPLLAQPTEAVLVLLPPSCPSGFYANNGSPIAKTSCVFEREAFTVGSAAKANPWNKTSTTAVLEMQLPNRYFIGQTFYFEEDAVIQSQGAGHEAIVGPPPLTITKTGSNTSISTTFLGLYGNATVVIGQGSEEVYSQLVTTSQTTSNGLFLAANGSAVPFNFTFQIGTRNLCAWYSYFTNLTSAAGILPAAYSLTSSAALPPSSSVCTDPTGITYMLTFKLLNIEYASAVTASVEVSLGVGVA
jgi:hypothetical protein